MRIRTQSRKSKVERREEMETEAEERYIGYRRERQQRVQRFVGERRVYTV